MSEEIRTTTLNSQSSTYWNMKIDLAFTPHELEQKDLEGKSVVVIDALRATTTMIVAFENGCSAFIPVATVEEARELAARESRLPPGGRTQGRRASKVFIWAILPATTGRRR